MSFMFCQTMSILYIGVNFPPPTNRQLTFYGRTDNCLKMIKLFQRWRVQTIAVQPVICSARVFC